MIRPPLIIAQVTLLLSVITLSLLTRVNASTEDLKIPNLGESSTSLFSADYEYEIGRMWLRSFRGQAPLVNDPLLHSYLENLTFELAQHSDLQDRRIELVIVDNPSINAFAVPGGVMGVHNGLFLYAQTEDEFATVMAHEIAHLIEADGGPAQLAEQAIDRREELGCAVDDGAVEVENHRVGRGWHRSGSRERDGARRA